MFAVVGQLINQCVGLLPRPAAVMIEVPLNVLLADEVGQFVQVIAHYFAGLFYERIRGLGAGYDDFARRSRELISRAFDRR